MEIKILGTKYNIIETELKDSDGECDPSTKTILIDTALNRKPSGNDKGDLKSYKRKVLRHEIIHAVMEESGIGHHDDMSDERFVDWIAIMYPKFKKIFEKLDIEN